MAVRAAGRRGAGHRAVERADHPGRARHRHAAGLRQHRRAEGQRAVPAHARLIIEAFAGRRLPAGVVNFVTNAPADAGAVVEAMVAHPAVRRVNFTGSHARGPDHRDDVRQAPQAGRAGTRRQGAAGGAGRRRHRRRRQRRGLRLLCQQRARSACSTERIIVDQKIADDFVKKFADKARESAAGRPAQARAGGAGLGDRHEHGGALQRADRRRRWPRAPSWSAAARPIPR